MFKLSQLEKTWTKLEAKQDQRSKLYMPKPRWGSTLSHIGNKLYLIGGFNRDKKSRDEPEGGFLADILSFDLTNSTWKYLIPRGIQFKARSNHSSITIGEK